MKFLFFLICLTTTVLGRDCQPIKLKMIDENPVEKGQSEATVIFSCHGGYLEVPDSTSLHFITSTPSSVCYSDRSCGNLEGIEGNLEVKYSSSINYSGTLLSTLSSYFTSTAENLPGGLMGAYVSFKTDFVKLESYCTEMSEPICFPKHRR